MLGVLSYIVTLFLTSGRFQSTPPREGRRGIISTKKTRTGFNPRPHARGDSRLLGAELRGLMFQSTPPREGRQQSRSLFRSKRSFNPRPHARGDMDFYRGNGDNECFNPRPHARGDMRFIDVRHLPKGVSIHAPARGATFPLLRYLVTLKFQSTPPRGGRLVLEF